MQTFDWDQVQVLVVMEDLMSKDEVRVDLDSKSQIKLSFFVVNNV